MTVLFVILGFIIGIYLFTPKQNTKKALCKMHKWVYNNEGTEEEYMNCTVCGHIPGQIDDGSVL